MYESWIIHENDKSSTSLFTSASVSENGREFPTVGQKSYVSAANLGLVFIKIKLKNPLI